MTPQDIRTYRDPHRSIAEYFTTHAESWRDRYNNNSFDAHQYRKRADLALSWLGRPATPQNRQVLEVGCGAGIQAGLATRLGWDVVAADISLGMLQLAAREIQGPRWLAATAEAMPLRPHSVDAVLALGLIAYVPDASATLAHLRELLGPRGRLIISWASPRPPLLNWIGTGVSAVPRRLYAGIKRARGQSIARVDRDGSFYDAYSHHYLPEEFLGLLERSGFRLLRLQGYNFGVFRVVGKALWPESVDVRLTSLLERSVGRVHLRPFVTRARNYLAMATPAAR